MQPSACSITTLAQSDRSPCHFVSHPFSWCSGDFQAVKATSYYPCLEEFCQVRGSPMYFARRCTQPPQPPPPSACSITTLAQSGRSPCHFVSHPFHGAVVTSGQQRPPVTTLISQNSAKFEFRPCTPPPVHATTATNTTKCLLNYHPRTERPQSMPLRDPSLFMVPW